MQVSNLKLQEFGGGLTQLLYLTIEDIQEFQLDRINFRIKDVERGMLQCYCTDFEIREVADSEGST